MAADTTILGGDVSVWYLSNNRTKMLDWSGSATGTRTMNELYSAMANLLDESDTIDDGSCFNADTPTEYTTGKIDAGDNDPWYVTFNLMQHITGGSLKTSGWARATGSNTGIVIIPVSSNTFTSGDIGALVEHAVDGDDGTLLEIIADGTNTWLVIRPDTSAAGDDWNSTSGSIQVEGGGGNSATQDEAANTGDMIWANIYSIGTVDTNVHMYVYQGEFDADTPATPATDGSNRVYSINSTTLDYWGQGHIDICVPIKDWTRSQTDGAWDVIDGGYLRVFARKGGDLFSSFEVANSITAGGRNPVPLQTAGDLNQGTGTKTISFTGAVTGTFEDGEVIRQTDGTNTGAQGILDLTNSDVGSGGYLSYFPIAENDIGGDLLAMESGQTITGQSSTATCTTDGTPADAGPALNTWFTNNAFPALTIGQTNFTGHNADIDNNGTDENYGILVDCNSNTLAEVYEWLKFICQYTQGETDPVEQAFEDDISQVNIFGEEFEGGMSYIGYSAISGTIPDGEGVTQATSGATGYIISHDTTADIVLLRNVRGTFDNSNQVDSDYDSDYFTPDEAGNFAASVASPFGTFAGGTFFGARGILLKNWLAADENSFILTDIEGTTRERPTSITFEVTNLWGNAITNADADLVAIYLLTASGGDVDKDTMACDGGEAEGGTTLAVDAIPTWVPASGRLVLVDISDDGQEYVIGYSSYDAGTDTFTLDSSSAFAALTGSTDENTLVSSTDELDSLERGDFIWNETQNAGAYVSSVDAASNTVELDRNIASQTNGDTIKANVVPITVAGTDKVYALIMHAYPTTDTEQVSLIYPGSTMYYRVKVRNTRETDLSNGPIKPFSSDGSTSGTDQSIPTVRTIDTVIS